MSVIGFIGLGNMGGGMAANLVKAGHSVHAFDLSKHALEKAKAAGCKIVANVNDAAKDSEVVILMLPDGDIVRTVCEDVFFASVPGALIIDCSTIDIPTARNMISEAEKQLIEMVDAPVSGGVSAAAAGTLTFMVGGKKNTFEKAKPFLDIMGKNIFHAGDAGNGQVAKVCNNMLLGISMIGTCEAFVLAKKLGLDVQTFFNISSKASGQNWSMTSYCPAPGPVPTAPSNNDYLAGFTAAMMLKDMRLAQHAAASTKASTPLGAQAEALYALLEQSGNDNLDFSAIMKLIDGSL